MRTKVSAAGLLLLALVLSVLTPALATAGDSPELAPVTSVTSAIRTDDLAAATDLTFLAEGYTEDEQPRFLADARAMTDQLDSSPAAEPMRRRRTFNYHHVFVASRSRASAGARPLATPFRAHVEEDRAVVDESRVAKLAELAPDSDVTIVLVRFKGRAGDGVRATARIPRFLDDSFERGAIVIPADDADDFLHELGHALWGLGDEYAEADADVTAARKAVIAERPNLSTDRTGARWKWAARGDPHPYEGGGRLRKGVFRPARDCIMRDLAARGFCPVCRAVLGGAFDYDPPDAASLEVAQGPLRGELMVAGAPLEARWRSGPLPVVAWAVVLVRISARNDEIVSTVVEGHRTTLALEALEPGRYELRVQARNIAPRRGSWVTFGFTVAPLTARE